MMGAFDLLISICAESTHGNLLTTIALLAAATEGPEVRLTLSFGFTFSYQYQGRTTGRKSRSHERKD